MNSRFGLIGLVLIFSLSFGACKSKESAYKAAYEKAKDKEMTESSSVEEVTPVSKPKQSSTTTASFQKEKVTAVGSGAGLRRYNVVIGSFLNKTNAESLKEKMEGNGYKTLLAQNEKMMYRVIVASFEDKVSAADERDSVKEKYYPDFQDAWLLEVDN